MIKFHLRGHFNNSKFMSASSKRYRDRGSSSGSEDKPAVKKQLTNSSPKMNLEKACSDDDDNSMLISDTVHEPLNSVSQTCEASSLSSDDKLDLLVASVSEIKTKLKKLDLLDTLETNIKAAQSSIKTINMKLDEKDKEVKALQSEVKDLRAFKDRVIQLEAYGRRDNLLIENLPAVAPSETDEKCKELVYDFLVTKLKIRDARDRIKIVRAHRLGISVRGRPKPIIVRFHFFPHRQEVWNLRLELKGSDIWLSEDYPEEIRNEREILKPYFNQAYKMELKPKLVLNKLILAGKPYTVETIGQLPDTLQEGTLFNTGDDLVLFHGYKHPFSNLYPSKFEQEGRIYSSVEQYIQSRKAEICGDFNAADRCMETSNSKKLFKVGKDVKTTPEWERMRLTTMKTAVYMKFHQNQHLKKLLLSTGSRSLVAANPWDKFWGTGLHIGHPDCRDEYAWPGENHLGRLLMEVRGDLE